MFTNIYKRFLKSVFDITIGILSFIILLPFFIMVMLLLLIFNNGKVFFLQNRPGINGNIFKVIKFKTMNDRRNKAGELLSDEERLTAIGSFIRKTSLDEIPQLLNVIKGDMSLIGPRPLLVEYLPLYNKFQSKRHEVKPGITGWAQVNGRNAIRWNQKFEYDVWYVDHVNFILDIKIMYLTIIKIFRSEGISSATSATMEKFTGELSSENQS